TNDAAVSPTVLRDVAGATNPFRIEQLCRFLLVDVHSKTWLVVGVQVTPFQDRVAGKRLELLGAEVVLFLNSEVPARQVQLKGSHLVDRVGVSTLLPGRLDAEPLGKVSDLLGLGNPTNLGHPYADEVDQSLGDQRH